MNCRFVTGATECCVYATIVGSVDVGRGGETPSAGNAESKIPREPDGAAFYPQVLGFGLVIIDIETAGNNRDPLLDDRAQPLDTRRSEEHTSELQSLMRISYAVFCLIKKNLLPRQRTDSSLTSSSAPLPYYDLHIPNHNTMHS